MEKKAVRFVVVLCLLLGIMTSSCVLEFRTREYKVGDVGPAGGYVFYDCDADNDSGNADGLISSLCGWRYLEVAPSDTGKLSYGYFRPDGASNVLTSASSTALGSGQANTKALVASMGEATYTTTSSEQDKTAYAAKSCTDFSVQVGNKTYKDWFLPSKDELNALYVFAAEFGLLDEFSNYDYWSSSEQYMAQSWLQNFNTGNQYLYDKADINCVRAIRAFM
jgi:hypothetical protein